MRKSKVIVISSIICACIAFAIYTGFWFWMADQIRQEMGAFINNADEEDIHLFPREIDVRGYPGKHEAYFSGRAAAGEYIVEVPALYVRSHFIPGDAITIEAPSGGILEGSQDAALWSLDRLKVESHIPLRLPADFTHEDLTAWRDSGQKIVIENMEMGKGPLAIKATGEIAVDNALQPAGTFTARMTGYIEFLQWLQAQKYVETKQALLAGTILTGLTRTDPESGQTYIDVNLTLQNQTLFLGPIRLGKVPLIEWGWRQPPAPDYAQ